MFDLREPHGAYMAQGIGVSQREAQHHYIRPREGETVFRSGLSTIATTMGEKMAEAKKNSWPRGKDASGETAFG